MPVHVNGRICDMKKIKAIANAYKLKIVEDGAQSLGARKIINSQDIMVIVQQLFLSCKNFRMFW